MENFAIIIKEEHTEVCILTPNITVIVNNSGNGAVGIDISGRDDSCSSVYFDIDCGDFKGRYIEDYDKETQKMILDTIETTVASDIAKYAELGYTYVGVDIFKGEDRSDCFYLEDYKEKWKNSYRCLLEIFHHEATQKNIKRQ